MWWTSFVVRLHTIFTYNFKYHHSLVFCPVFLLGQEFVLLYYFLFISCFVRVVQKLLHYINKVDINVRFMCIQLLTSHRINQSYYKIQLQHRFAHKWLILLSIISCYKRFYNYSNIENIGPTVLNNDTVKIASTEL